MAGDGVLLGFDFGLRRIGVAVGETITGRARPLLILSAQDGRPDWAQIESLLREWQPTALVVGVPRHADGAAGAVTAPAQRFARRLHGRFGLPVHTIDEQLSSHAATDALRTPGRRRGGGAQAIDAAAAAIILETWLAEPTHD